jgi:hypothetical protein
MLFIVSAKRLALVFASAVGLEPKVGLPGTPTKVALVHGVS